jgi:hypothetical protein
VAATSKLVGVPRVALLAVAAGQKAQADHIKNRVSPWDPKFKGPLNTRIKLDSVQKIQDLLDLARADTPHFLRGVLITPAIMAEIYEHLRDIDSDLYFGARFEHSLNESHEAGQKNLSTMLTTLIGGVVKPKGEQHGSEEQAGKEAGEDN